jgi:hypothetical protein
MRGLAFHRLVALSGLLTGIVAGTATLGHVIGLRNGELAAGQDFHIARLFLRWWTTVGFTAAQEIGWDVYKATAYSAAHTGGTGAANVTLSPRGDYTANTTVVARTAGTDALTAGTHTIGGRVLSIGGQELATGAAVVNKTLENELISYDRHPVEILKPDEGLIVRNCSVAMGAGGVGRLLLIAEGWMRDSSP